MSVRKFGEALTQEVMAYFSDKEAHFAPSEIDVVMGLPRGMAHDIIVRKWASDKADTSERLFTYHEQL